MASHIHDRQIFATINVILLLALCSCPCAAQYLRCQQIDLQESNCRCQFNDTAKTVIDFAAISRNDGKPEFPFAAYSTTESDWTYAFNPCKPFDGPVGCKGTSVCQQSKKTPADVFNLGDPDPTAWTTKNQNNILVTYASPDPAPNKRTSLVTFTCDKTAVSKPSLEFVMEAPSKSYQFTVKTCLACLEKVPGCGITSSRLTAGGVLCIIFAVLVIVYFVGGILFQKFGRGATGKELIPNYGFWSDFPMLIKDGVLFMVSPCTKNDGYSSI